MPFKKVFFIIYLYTGYMLMISSFFFFLFTSKSSTFSRGQIFLTSSGVITWVSVPAALQQVQVQSKCSKRHAYHNLENIFIQQFTTAFDIHQEINVLCTEWQQHNRKLTQLSGFSFAGISFCLWFGPASNFHIS